MVAIALALPALAGVGEDAPVPDAQRQSQDGPGAGQSAPDPVAPAIIAAALGTSTTLHPHLVAESQRPLGPALSVLTASTRRSAVPFCATRPRAFPLLI